MSKNFVASVFMVSGCAMGAGCLAMPMLAAGPNFIFSSLFLIIIGGFSYLLAITSLEIFLHYKNEINLSTIAGNNFGKSGVIFSGVVNGALMYALLSVYMTGGADLLDKTILPIFNLHLSNSMSLLIFLVVTLPIFFKGTNLVVKSNKLVFWVKLLSFLSAVLFGLKFISPSLMVFKPHQIEFLPKALPVLLGALWFHFLIPIIAKINDYDRERCKRIFAVGLVLPVVLYILWIGIMLSLVPRDGVGHTFLSLLTAKESVGTMISYATNNNPLLPEIMKILLNVFSNIAMLTSFLAVGISTYDYMRDAFKIKQTAQGRALNVFITMFPPAFFAIFFPNGFVFVLQQAIILLMIINGLMLVCVIKEYKSLSYKPSKPLVYSLLFGLAFLILLQLLDNFALLPSFGA